MDRPQLHIQNEIDRLTDLCVCLGTSIPDMAEYETDHPEFTKYRITPWNRELFLQQQQAFFEICTRYGVRLHFAEGGADLPWLAYTRDTGFVVGETLFYCRKRGLPDRKGEIDAVRQSLPFLNDKTLVEITAGHIEGGDVLVHEGMAYVGISARSSADAVAALGAHVNVHPLFLGETVMHLDTRLTLLPKRLALIHTASFRQVDLAHLAERFDFIEVTPEECETLGTNVFVLNPETVVVHTGHERVAREIEARGLTVERIDYSEPIALAGSFRCTTMPLARVG